MSSNGREIKQNIAITGASSGIGKALALEFAQPDHRLFLCARNGKKLKEVTEQCREKGAEAEFSSVDVCKSSVVKWIKGIDRKGPIDLLVVNAGVYGGSPKIGEMENLAEAKKIIRTNLMGAMATASQMAGTNEEATEKEKSC